MQSLKISHRLIFLVLLSVVALIVMAVGFTYRQEQLLVERAEVQNHNILFVVQSYLRDKEAMARKGFISEEEAKKQALEFIGKLRFGYQLVVDTGDNTTEGKTVGDNKSNQVDDAYIVVQDNKGVILSDANQDRVGTIDKTPYSQDPKLTISEAERNLAAQGGGEMRYSYVDLQGKKHLKVESVDGFKPWGWVIYTGTNYDAFLRDIQQTQAYKGMINFMFLLGVVVVAIMLLVALYISRSIVIPIRSLNQQMIRVADGDIDVEVSYAHYKNSIGELSRSMAVFIDKNKQIIDLREEQKRSELEAKKRQKEEMIQLSHHFDEKVMDVLRSVSEYAERLQETSRNMNETASDAQNMAQNVSQIAGNASGNVQSVASATEELSASIGEITSQVAHSTSIVHTAVEKSQVVNKIIGDLSEAAHKVGQVVELITSIADKTNLLALNATIEAARAGEAGKGFSVVASEVKNLSNQTSRATEEISQHIASIQRETKKSVEALGEITKIVEEVNVISSSINAAVEEQSAATQEISENAEYASSGTMEAQENALLMLDSAEKTGGAASDVLSMANDLTDRAHHLQQEVDLFLRFIRKDG